MIPNSIEMLLLVTDTSGRQGSVALARTNDPGRVEVVEVALLAGGMFSAQLVPQIAGLLARHHFAKSDIDVFIVVSGPGSFTGLRVGLAAIKALAEILNKPIVPVSLLQVVAVASGTQGRVVALLDAGRGDVYFGAYEIAGESVEVQEERLMSKNEFLSTEFLSTARDATVAIPDAAWAAVAREAGLSVVEFDPPEAGTIAKVGLIRLRAGGTVSPERLEANYMRRSDAEMFVKKSS
jgi:tRNA threonylcarbamoyladenosine biosynthesis protein TsaB